MLNFKSIFLVSLFIILWCLFVTIGIYKITGYYEQQLHLQNQIENFGLELELLKLKK